MSSTPNPICPPRISGRPPPPSLDGVVGAVLEGEEERKGAEKDRLSLGRVATEPGVVEVRLVVQTPERPTQGKGRQVHRRARSADDGEPLGREPARSLGAARGKASRHGTADAPVLKRGVAVGDSQPANAGRCLTTASLTRFISLKASSQPISKVHMRGLAGY